MAKFQSTAPVWGPTIALQRAASTPMISIHGPRVGADGCRAAAFAGAVRISIHGPRVGADAEGGEDFVLGHISIHGPRVGADGPIGACAYVDLISIHGPRVGADGATGCSAANVGISIHGPRVGADLVRSYFCRGLVNFNPRPPCGGRPIASRPRNSVSRFQSTAPVWGPTLASGDRLRAYAKFQSTAPVWGPTLRSFPRCANCGISIHGPRVGADGRIDAL